MEVSAIAPNRIDLAWGTLDLYPLYLFEEGGITVNMAIDVGSRVTVRTRSDREVHVYSLDTGHEMHARHVSELPLGGPLDLLARIIRFYRPNFGLDVWTRNDAPKGSGLGASSALLIALSHALNVLGVERLSEQEIIRIGANLEAQTIRIPTGKQDYYAATYGGVNAIWFEVGKDRVERLVVSEKIMEALESRLILSFTGEPHDSAVTNWSMLKAYIQNEGHTVAHMKQIKATALAMREALLAEDFERLAQLLAEEWDNRRQLAAGVTTPQVDRLMQAAREAGALASKLCGAGGGGCMVTIVSAGNGHPHHDARHRVAEALEAHGAQVMPFHIARTGVILEVNGNHGVHLAAPVAPAQTAG